MKDQVKEKKIAVTSEKQMLTEMAVSVLGGNESILNRVEELNGLVEKKERLQKDLVYLTGEEKRLMAMRARLDKSFGEVDTIKDLERMEECEIKHRSTVQAIRLIQQQVEDTSALSKDIRDCRAGLNDLVDVALWPLAEQWQKDIDERVSELLQRFDLYSIALNRVSREQTFVDKRHLDFRSILSARPTLSSLDELMLHFKGPTPMFAVPVGCNMKK